MTNLVAVIIIVHKPVLSVSEKMSLMQCYKILYKYPIKIICPAGLNVDEYKMLQPDAAFEFIDSKWQSDYYMFNQLKINALLYKRFNKFKYLLFYELDAWVFKDEIQTWTQKKFDYIGAAWFDGWSENGESDQLTTAGNGGFSLRNNKKAIQLLKRIKVIKKIKSLTSKIEVDGFSFFIRTILLFNFYFKIKNTNMLPSLVQEHTQNEDIFWAVVMPNVFKDFKVANAMQAIPFSFETSPSLLYRMNGNTLPFGCHAWQKYEPEFWSRFISMPNTA